MLITISGIVGSGKSTTARTVMRLLTDSGLQPRYLRFRYLRLLAFSNPARPKPEKEAANEPVAEVRARHFRSQPLSTMKAAGYAMRILAFRLSGIGRGSRYDVVDRYFFDNFVQYDLRSRRERLYLRLLQRLIPRPDLALLVVASDATIRKRRGNYAPEYLSLVGQRYRELPRLFPELTTISTDEGGSDDDRLERTIRMLVQGKRT